MHGLDLDELRRQLSDPWASDDTPLGGIAERVDALATRAYSDRDVAARREAEELLYVINVANCFAPPLHAAPALAWTALMRRKVNALRSEFGGCEPIDAVEMKSRLLAAVAKWGAYNHPLVGAIDDLGAYRIWAKNWYGSCVGFSAQLAALVQRTNGTAKKVVLENLADEFDDRVTHDVMRIRFYESLGLKFDTQNALADPDRVVEATELLNARTALSFMRDPIPALGCFYGVEANWPPECKLHLAINRKRGADEHTLEYWTSHAEADEDHSAEWLATLVAMTRTNEERASAVDGAIMQLRLRWQMYDAIARRISERQS
jgi:pyrroloquinoline quinone (PQQ) biosynthesis protein C